MGMGTNINKLRQEAPTQFQVRRFNQEIAVQEFKNANGICFQVQKMFRFVFLLVCLIGFGICVEDEHGEASMDGALRAASGGLLDIDQLVSVVEQRLEIATLKSGVATLKGGVASNKKDISALRGDMTHCITGTGNYWGIPDGKPDGKWTKKTINFGKTFSKKPQVMVAVMGAGRGFTHKSCYGGVPVEFGIHKNIKVTKSSVTVEAYAASKDQTCHFKSALYFSYIACGTY